MSDFFESPRSMLDGSQENIDAFDTLAQAFIHQSNWTGFVEVDPKTGEHVLKVRFKSDMPAAMARRAYDVHRYLRDALDHALFASALMINGREPSRYKFAFGDTAPAMEAEIMEGRCDDLHADILKIIISSHAYEAGNRALWAINKVRNKNSHRILTPAVAAGQGFAIISGTFCSVGVTAKTINEWRSTRRELSCVRMKVGPHTKFQIEPTIMIGLAPDFGFGGRTASEAFAESYTVVSDIISRIESETLRISAAENL